MTMHLVGPALSNISTKKRQGKITKAKQAELESGWRDRNKWLISLGMPKQTFDEYTDWVYGRGEKTKKSTSQKSKTNDRNYSSTDDQNVHSHSRIGPQVTTTPVQCSLRQESTAKAKITAPSRSEWVKGTCSTKPSPTYTGTEIIGLSVLHKSCIQPVFSQEAAKDIAKMRR